LVEVREIVNKEYSYVNIDDPISKTFTKFQNQNELVVTGEGKFQGFIVEKDIIRVKVPVDSKVRTFLKHVPKLDINDTISTAARLMLENDLYQLPIFENDKFIGIVSVDAVLKKSMGQTFANEKIEKFMSYPIISLIEKDSIGKAINILMNRGISRLPVMENGKIVGLITMNDIIKKIVHPEDKAKGRAGYGEFVAEKKHFLKLPINGFMTNTPILVSPEADVFQVINKMTNNNAKEVLVGSENKLYGIVTKKDLLEPIAAQAGIEKDKIVIQFAGDIDKIDNFDQNELKKHFQGSMKKFEDFLESGYLYVHIKVKKENEKGVKYILCRFRLSSPKGMFIAENEGWEYMMSIKHILDSIEKQIKKVKENIEN
jgi:CBS domain-containing protein/ribosome-associated translation inhibitor RaiA